MDKDHRKYLDQFYSDREVGDEERDKANEEMRFCFVDGGQWEGDHANGYENRAKMEIDQTSPYIWRTYADHCDNRVTVKFSPDDDKTDDDTAEILEGLYRRDVIRRGGQDAIDTAFLESISCGFGAVVLNTVFEDDEDPENNNMNIVLSEQVNAYSTVFFDSSAKRADKSDAEHCTILNSYSKEKFAQLWPDADPVSVDPDNRSHFSWNDADLIYVVTRYHIGVKSENVYSYAHTKSSKIVKLVGDKENKLDSKELIRDGYRFLRKRRIKVRSVYKTVFSGGEILDKTEKIAGKHIPVVPFYGYRGFIDDKEYYYGLARRRMDVQRILNMVASLTAESAATSHEPKPVFSPEQMANPSIQKLWSQDKSQVPFLLAEDVTDPQTGQIVRSGPSQTIEGGGMTQSSAALMQMANDLIREGTGGAPQDIADPNASGKAINALIKRSDQNVRPIFDNRNKSHKRIGEVYRCQAAEVYAGAASKGRAIKLVTERADTKSVTLMDRPTGEIGYKNDISSGKFEVVVDVGKDYLTQTEETFEKFKDIYASMMPQDPLRPTIFSRMLQNMPSDGMDDLKDYLRKQELASGTARPANEEEEQYLQQLQQQPQAPNANDEYLMAEADRSKATTAKVLVDARLSEAKTQETIAKAQKTKVETAVKAEEIRKGL